ncbi:DUF308 domain-containing protein [Leifsonia sp. NPDC058230]|uniref:DUF308 domain-containing protein n=1 Tax=Leifsonia sp. NPDC058230 TaxID=3346391 RepID=UPI0036D7709F
MRAGFSIVWVALVFTLATSATVGAGPTAAASVLLTIYPLWDVCATIFDIRVNRGTGQSLVPQYLNIVFGIAATVATIISLTVGLTPTLIVFGIWATLTGAVQLFLAIRRRRALGGQWPMIISGGLSFLAGFSFILTSGTPSTGLATLAGYSAFGAFWYLVGAIWLSVGRRRAEA